MKTIYLIVMLALPVLSSAQEQQADCMQRFDDQLKGVGAEMANIAGSVNYGTLLERVTQCVQAGKCVKMDVFISISELMVDEKAIKLQREKLSLLKAYAAKNKNNFRSNNYCAVQATFPALLEKIQSLNQAQLDRYNELMKKTLDALPKA